MRLLRFMVVHPIRQSSDVERFLALDSRPFAWPACAARSCRNAFNVLSPGAGQSPVRPALGPRLLSFHVAPTSPRARGMVVGEHATARTRLHPAQPHQAPRPSRTRQPHSPLVA